METKDYFARDIVVYAQGREKHKSVLWCYELFTGNMPRMTWFAELDVKIMRISQLQHEEMIMYNKGLRAKALQCNFVYDEYGPKESSLKCYKIISTGATTQHCTLTSMQPWKTLCFTGPLESTQKWLHTRKNVKWTKVGKLRWTQKKPATAIPLHRDGILTSQSIEHRLCRTQRSLW